ncbi:phage head-tail joining protein [Pseudaminobacter soli (ex Li et al. 2025)]|uniref:Uncharacterized protein n=1 Tax=Pseudaminobacter soli (ex Li et al. 2025) TaxID=1295366 RepID=A0A2P7RZX2_9HYPH|nr:hypothetical protein [Mesorhizobium soli]PSJ55769.1 hypothetical protein C7I85_26120 [Mesorhizobium soli]
MAYSQAQIDALKAAMASGVLTVRHGETTTTFRSLAEMQKQLADMEADVSASPTRPRRTVAGFSNGC